MKKESDEVRFDTALALLKKGSYDQTRVIFEEIVRQKEAAFYSKVGLIKILLKSSEFVFLQDKVTELSLRSQEYYWDYRNGKVDQKYKIKTMPEDLEQLSADVGSLCNELSVQLSTPMRNQLYVLDELIAKSIELKETGEQLLTDELQLQMQEVQKEYDRMKWLLESAGLANVSTQQAFRFRSLWLKDLPKNYYGRSQGVSAKKSHIGESPQQCLSKLEEEAEKVETLLSRHGCIAKMASALVGG